MLGLMMTRQAYMNALFEMDYNYHELVEQEERRVRRVQLTEGSTSCKT